MHCYVLVTPALLRGEGTAKVLVTPALLRGEGTAKVLVTPALLRGKGTAKSPCDARAGKVRCSSRGAARGETL